MQVLQHILWCCSRQQWKFGVDIFCIFSVNLNFNIGLEHPDCRYCWDTSINMLFFNILTAYKISCVFPLLEIFTECLFTRIQRKTVFNQITPSDNASWTTSILTKTVIVKFRIFCFGNILLYNRQKRDTGNNIDTDQRYTETKISRKTFMLDNIRMVGNGHNTNYVAQFLWYWDILLEKKVFYVSLWPRFGSIQWFT